MAGKTNEGEDHESDNDGDKRPRTASSQSDYEEERRRKANPTVTRSPFQDVRERPQESRDHGGRQVEERRNRRHHKESTYGTHTDRGKSGHRGGSQRALEGSRCHDELRLRAGYARDLEKHMEAHNRLFTMDHYTPLTDLGRRNSRTGKPSKTACTGLPRARQPWTPRS